MIRSKRQRDDLTAQSLPLPTERYGLNQAHRLQSFEECQNAESVTKAQRLARSLGWLSLGLGLTKLVTPRTIARVTGLNSKHGVIRLLGLREILHGVSILNSPKPIGPLWSRVLGDIIDLAVLRKGAASPNASRGPLIVTAAVVAGVTVLDFKASQSLTRNADKIKDDFGEIHITKTVLINRSTKEIYSFWRNYSNLARVMSHLESVEDMRDNRSRWIAKGLAGKRLKWDAETTEDRPNEFIAWSSIPGSDVENSGSVKFESVIGKPATLVRVELNYRQPMGALAATVAKFFGAEPEIQLRDDLHRLKQVLEAGEIITTEGQSAGRKSSTSWKYDKLARRLATAV
jgi:uncharacterized membrane protein